MGLSDTRVLAPVELVLVQQCHFKAKACKECGLTKTNPVHSKRAREDGSGHAYARTLGCAKCGRYKNDRTHLELAMSLRDLGSGDPRKYIEHKKRLQHAFAEALAESELPRGLERVTVECQVVFGDRHGRDEGNIRFFPEKCLGDALVHGSDDIAGGWLSDDTFYPERRYTFGGIDPQYDPSVVTVLRLMIFPG